MTHVRVCWANAWGARATQIGAGMRRSFVTPDEVYVALVALLCADLGPAVSARAVGARPRVLAMACIAEAANEPLSA